MTRNEGGCLCGRIRYATLAKPKRVTICHCKFCQKATGSAYMVEPIFEDADFVQHKGSPRIYDQISAGSGHVVHMHFCADCGTKLWLSFERFPGAVGIYAGTFDDPCWFPIDPASSRHIFLEASRSDTVIPAGVPTFVEHATAIDGSAQEKTIYATHHKIGS